jgi:hypothetical protein
VATVGFFTSVPTTMLAIFSRGQKVLTISCLQYIGAIDIAKKGLELEDTGTSPAALLK